MWAMNQPACRVQPVTRRSHRDMAAVRCYAIAARGHSQDQVIVLHKIALACAVQAINLFGVLALYRSGQTVDIIH